MLDAEYFQLRRIQSVTDAALGHLDVEDLLVELLDRVRELLQVDTATVLLLDPSSQELVVTAARALEATVRQGIRIPMGKGFAGRVAAGKQPVIIERVDDTNVLYSILLEHGICSLLGVPLLISGTVIGVLHVGTFVSRRFSDDDVELLQIVADRVASATQSRRAEVERSAATVLQRSLLPARLPVVPGLEFAARYVPAENGGVGGDWYDVFTLPSGWLCIVIGDVVGRGLGAADLMGRLRSLLRAYAMLGGDPAAVLDRVDRSVQHFEPEMMATVLLAMFEPSLERLHLSSAGHPPPVLALPDQPSALLDVPSDHPVGVPGGLRRRATTINVPLGALLCFYTDGLVESRDISLDAGLERLCKSVVAGPVESVCGTVMAQLVGGNPPDDDVAVLAVRRQDGGEIGPVVPDPSVGGAIQLDEDTLTRYRRVLGNDHPDTLRSAHNLAVGLRALGEHEQARELGEDTLSRRRRVLGDDHPDTLLSAHNLAVGLRALGEHERARRLHEDTLTRRRRVLGDDHPDTLRSANNLANNLSALGEHEQARELHEDTLTRRRRVLGNDHPHALLSANNLAADLGALGEHEQARELDEDTLTRYRRVLGDDHHSTLLSANNLAADLRALGEQEQARQLEEWIKSRYQS
ncbi:MAG: tetratricopeptide repeat protein [Pseudonocardiaceae bacterium]